MFMCENSMVKMVSVISTLLIVMIIELVVFVFRFLVFGFMRSPK